MGNLKQNKKAFLPFYQFVVKAIFTALQCYTKYIAENSIIFIIFVTHFVHISVFSTTIHFIIFYLFQLFYTAYWLQRCQITKKNRRSHGFRRKPLVQFLYHILIYTNVQLPDPNLRKYARYEVKIVIITTENNSAFHNLHNPFIVTKQKHPS